MSARRDLEHRLASLKEIRGIMNSMKVLALMETRKLDRMMENQRELVATIDAAARDLIGGYPELLPADAPVPAVRLVIGSERGFCGDFNESLLAPGPTAAAEREIVVGRKLRSRMGDDPAVRAALDGASVAEDLGGVLARVVAAISELQAGGDGIGLVVRYHDREGDVPVDRTLMPPWQSLGSPQAAASRMPPVINLHPRAMFRELVDHYLYATLQEILLASLRAENHRRARHLEGAVNRLDERVADLQNGCRQLRQEEITEEIEVILLSAIGAAP